MKKRPRGKLFRFIIRGLVIWAVQVASLTIMASLLSGVEVRDWRTTILTAAVIGLLNALLWPTLSYIFLPFAVLTLGLFTLVLNGVLILFADFLVEGFQVNNLGTAMILALGLTAVSTFIGGLLNINDDSAWFRNILRRRMKHRGKIKKTEVPGFLFLEIDGLAKPVLERAIKENRMPTLARWLKKGNHRLVGWETDLSSQTSASQAGILHGNNNNIPAFRWYDRKKKEIVSSSNPKFLPELEKKLSNSKGLLVDDGASRGNLFSGDAPNVMNTGSTILDRTRFHTTDFYAFFLQPYNFARTLLLTIWDIILEIWQFYKARRKKVYPILDKKKRGGVYPLMRALTTVLMREINVYTLLGDIFAGVPAVYSTFVGYDEVAHHSGVESEDAFDILTKLDKQFARLETAAQEAPRPYYLVILSDHGQTNGATFKQRYDMTLEDLVQKLAKEKFRVQGGVDVHEDWGQLNVLLTETVRYDKKTVSKPLGKALKSRSEEGQVALGPEGKAKKDKAEPGSTIIVLASGNLGLVYGTQIKKRVTLEEIENYFPGMLDGLAKHKGVGFIMVHSKTHGPVVIGDKGRYFLKEDKVKGKNPLTNFGPNAAQHLKRNDGFPDAPDIYVSSFYNPKTKEGAAFEEQIGFHGGLGGPQTQPFLLYPTKLPMKKKNLIGAPAVHQVLKQWVASSNKKK